MGFYRERFQNGSMAQLWVKMSRGYEQTKVHFFVKVTFVGPSWGLYPSFIWIANYGYSLRHLPFWIKENDPRKAETQSHKLAEAHHGKQKLVLLPAVTHNKPACSNRPWMVILIKWNNLLEYFWHLFLIPISDSSLHQIQSFGTMSIKLIHKEILPCMVLYLLATLIFADICTSLAVRHFIWPILLDAVQFGLQLPTIG